MQTPKLMSFLYLTGNFEHIPQPFLVMNIVDFEYLFICLESSLNHWELSKESNGILYQ